MSEPFVNEQKKQSRLLIFLESAVNNAKGSTLTSYRKAFRLFRSFSAIHGGQDPDAEIIKESFLTDWIVYLWMNGVTARSALRYLDIISALYGYAVKQSVAEPTDVFSRLKSQLKNRLENLWSGNVTEQGFNTLIKSLRNRSTDSLSADIILYSLANGAVLPSKTVRLRQDDFMQMNEQSREIVAKYIDKRRRFLFPLAQSSMTSRQLDREADRIVRRFFDSQGIIWTGNAADTLQSYWAYAALRSGATASRVVRLLGGRPSGIPLFSLCRLTEKSENVAESGLIASVAELIVADKISWFAMRLRPGIKFGRIEEAVRAFPDPPQLFYPCEEIARRIKKKIVFKQRPVLHDIVFFRSRPSSIHRLFAAIGDMAWCYTSEGAYAPIPQTDMERFQRAVGHFAPGFEVGPVGSLPLRKGDRIVVIGGTLSGREGEIIEESYARIGVIYRILLRGDSFNIEWRAADPRLIEKL